MSDIHDDDKVHCFACYRLIRPGQIYHLTIEFEVLCQDCALSEGVIRAREDLAVEVKLDRLLVQHGKVDVEVLEGETRRSVNTSAQTTVKSVDRNVQDAYHSRQPGEAGEWMGIEIIVCREDWNRGFVSGCLGGKGWTNVSRHKRCS